MIGPDPSHVTTLPPPKRRPATDDPRTLVLALTVLAHPDAALVGARALLPSLSEGGAVNVSRLEPTFFDKDNRDAKLLADPSVSRKPATLVGRSDGVALEVGGTSTQVAVDGSTLKSEILISPAELEQGTVIELAERIALLLHWHAKNEPSPDYDMIGDSSAMGQLRLEIARVADTDVPILILGESGTGKEKVAHALHASSPRASEPFVAINMATLPPALAASQLFGHQRGAFSGADSDHVGLFSQANGGTLFLDEIAASPAEVQTMLLRVLEDRIVQPLGSKARNVVDVRVIAATDADLSLAVNHGEFRAPLLHRLAGYQISTPPLRERRDDLGRLLYHFLNAELAALGQEALLVGQDAQSRPWLPTQIVRQLAKYRWPGNVRELQNVARRLALLGRDRDVIALDDDLRSRLATPAKATTKDTRTAASSEPSRGPEVSDEDLIAVLARNRWKTSKTARDLGISRTTLYQLMSKCPGIQVAKTLTREEIEGAREKTGDNTTQMAEELRVSERGLKLRMNELGL